jgi:sporulation protein YlmC with PRC-barrel domain
MLIKQSISAVLLCLPLLLAGNSQAQVAGSTSLGVADLTLVANGWSVKKKVLGKTVYNEENKRVGKIQDIIVAPDGTASFIIVGAGGFLGVARHDVAVPVGQIVVQDDKFVLPGATKAAVKNMAKFEYTK